MTEGMREEGGGGGPAGTPGPGPGDAKTFFLNGAKVEGRSFKVVDVVAVADVKMEAKPPFNGL